MSSAPVVAALSVAVSSLVGATLESVLGLVSDVLGTGAGGIAGDGVFDGETALGVGGPSVGLGATVAGGAAGVTALVGLVTLPSVAVVETAGLLVVVGLVPLEQDANRLPVPNTPSSVNKERTVGDEIEWVMFETAMVRRC